MGALSHEIEGLLGRLRDESWTQRSDALREATALLAGGADEPEIEQRLGPLLLEAAKDGKWEVRKAAALALAEVRHLDAELTQETLAALATDSNRWVSQAALRAGRRLRSRAERAGDWPLTDGVEDPKLQYIVARTREIGLRSMTPAHIYDLATEIGERAYRELAADTAHEIRTMLTPLEGYLDELRRHLDEGGRADSTAEHYLAKGMARLQQLQGLVEDLRVYTSPGEAPFAPVELASTVQKAVHDGIERATASALISTRVDVPKGLVIDAIQGRLVRAIANLVANACQAMEGGGTLDVRARLLGDGLVELVVSDTGHGMTALQLEQAMERFGSTRRDDGGTGLGLPIAQQIIDVDHGGELSIESSPGEGTRVVIVLPVRRETDEV